MENKKGFPARNPFRARWRAQEREREREREREHGRPLRGHLTCLRAVRTPDRLRSGQNPRDRTQRPAWVGSENLSPRPNEKATHSVAFELARPERLRLAIHGRRPAGHRATHRAMTKRVPDAFVELPTSGALNLGAGRAQIKKASRGGLFICAGAPGEIRTPDLLVRSQTLYPTELRAHRTDRSREAGQIPVETGI